MDVHDRFVITPKTHQCDMFEFQRWFDQSLTMNELESMGHIDFMHHIFMYDSYAYVGDPSQKTALEIGSGGGRLTLPASYVFGNVVGIDVHTSLDVAQEYMTSRGRSNVKFMHFDDTSSINDASIDFAYSFITFQHFVNWNVAVEYLQLLHRVMKKGAFGVLYLAKHDERYGNDIILSSPTDDVSNFLITMTVKPTFALKEIERHGFTVIDTGTIKKRPWSSQDSNQVCVRFTR